MEWQTILVTMCVLAATAYLIRASLKSKRCGGGCDCAPKADEPAVQGLSLRVRPAEPDA
ncbi:MAG: FeoB-associated Cys-rich membrane protein [Gemmataceae bacterium]